MSNTLRNLLARLAYTLGGAYKTRSDRVNTVESFTDYLREDNINIMAIEHIKAKHIVNYIDVMKEKLSTRTIQNVMSHLRKVLRQAGREQLADNPILSNKNLGIAGGSRKGTKIPCSPEQFSRLLNEALMRDKGIAVCVMLGYYFGMRREEAIQSIQSIPTWYKQLVAGENRITLVFGSKGGRSRKVTITNLDMALRTLKFAMRVMEERNGKLIDKPNLKEACFYFSNKIRRIGFIGELSFHSLRYAFAVVNINFYLSEGKSLKEALALTSMDLGHGDKRGRYIKMVYARSLITAQEKKTNRKIDSTLDV